MIFFGRLRQIREIVKLIYVNPVLLLYSQSGAGKTSLIRAGVLPRLIDDGFEVLPLGRLGGFVPQDIKPEKIQNIFIFSYLLSSLGGKTDPTALTIETLTKYLQEIEHHLDEVGQLSPRVLIFDQFEELFTSHQDRWENRQGFFEQIRQALDSDHLLRVVFALREEYLGETERYAYLLPDGISARFHLERLREADALLAVSAPLETTGQYFAEGVAEKIVNDLMMMKIQTNEGNTRVVRGEFIEPVQLQVVLRDLWASLPRDRKVITEDYIAALLSSDAILINFFDRVVHDVVDSSPEITEEVLRNWFEEHLITREGKRGVVVEGKEETAGLPDHVIKQLVNKFIIRAEFIGGSLLYKLTNDKLISPIQKSNRRFFQNSKL